MAQSPDQEAPMSGAEFDAYTRGKTLTFVQDGVAYGAEQYYENRQVVWAFRGDQCIDGAWYEPAPGLICFVYEAVEDGPQCWHFFKKSNGLRAIFDGTDEPTELYETNQSNEALFCPGPEIGV